jgi:hypothetical protein
MVWAPGVLGDPGYPLAPTQLPETDYDGGVTDDPSFICALSGDGSTLGGSQSSFSHLVETGGGYTVPGGQTLAGTWRRPAVWAGGAQTNLDVLPMLDTTPSGHPGVQLSHREGQVRGIDHAGDTAVGHYQNDAGKLDAAIWDLSVTPPTVELLGYATPAPYTAGALDVSAHGMVVTGVVQDFSDPELGIVSFAFYRKSTRNGDPATGLEVWFGARIEANGEVFPDGTLVGNTTRDIGGDRGNTILYDVRLPGLGYPPHVVGTPFVVDLAVLEGDVPAISLSAGGTQTLSVDAGPTQAGQLYVTLGSASGESPGWTVGPAHAVDISGLQSAYDAACLANPPCTPPAALPAPGAGDMVLPLAPDSYFLATATTLLGIWPLGSLGLLDAEGEAASAISLPPGFNPTLAGAVLHHAYVVLDLGDLSARAVSNAVPVTLVP